jgi:hypothetical protein
MAMPGECFLFYFHYGTAYRAIIFAVITETTMSCSLGRWYGHRHLSNIDCLMVHTACLVCFISIVNGRSKKTENVLEDVALVAGTQQNLSNLYSLDIHGYGPLLSP